MTTSRTSIEQARDLVTIIGALAKDGDTLTAKGVAARLGIAEDEAARLLDLVVSAGPDDLDAARLPLSLDNAGGISYVAQGARSVRGRTLRLTTGEVKALSSAFDEAGLGRESSLRTAIERAIFPMNPDLSHVHESGGSEKWLSERLDALSQAILAKVAIEFDYEPPVASSAETSPLSRRHVVPQALRHERGHWYLDAFDIDRDSHRSFRLDRMGDPVTTAAHAKSKKRKQADGAPRLVNLLFSDSTLFEVHEWPGLVITGRGHGSTTCEIPWYTGSDWLPRRLAACGSSVRIYDPELKAAVSRYAHALLDARSR